ncbi:MAG: H-X9-DG-CTERM domain-containing protein, partial [Planctomycetota bacterium]
PLDGDWPDEERHAGQADTCFLSGDNLRVVMRGTEDGMASSRDDLPVSQEQRPWRRRGTQVFGGGNHPGVVNFVFLDGHTESLSTARDGFADVNPNGIGDVPDPADPNDRDEVERWGWFMALSTVAGGEFALDQ